MSKQSLSDVGAELIFASKAKAGRPGEVLEELFPYVFEASRRMSARDISRWLQEKHGIQISQPTISRALKDPEPFWTVFIDEIEVVTRRVATSMGIQPNGLLFDDTGDEQRALYEWVEVYERAKKELGKEEMAEVEDGLNVLREKWFSLSPATRAACAKWMTDDETEETRDGN